MLKTSFTQKEFINSGLALVLMTLLLGLFMKETLFYQLATGEVVLLMVFPAIFYPFSFIWLNLSDLMSKIMSKFILTWIYIILILPIGMVRRALGKDTLKLNEFYKDRITAFTERNHIFIKDDLSKPF